jgi:hypothetical protein
VRREAVGRRSRSIASLLLRTPLRVLNMSRSGCLLECPRPIEAGTAGRLRIEIDGRTYSEEVRVVRCAAIRSAGPFRLGVEFLKTRPAHAASLRRASLLMFEQVYERDRKAPEAVRPPRSVAATATGYPTEPRGAVADESGLKEPL